MQMDFKTGHKTCCKGFSKPYQPETTIQNDGYPLYCCRNNGRGYIIPHPLFKGQEY